MIIICSFSENIITGNSQLYTTAASAEKWHLGSFRHPLTKQLLSSEEPDESWSVLGYNDLQYHSCTLDSTRWNTFPLLFFITMFIRLFFYTIKCCVNETYHISLPLVGRIYSRLIFLLLTQILSQKLSGLLFALALQLWKLVLLWFPAWEALEVVGVEQAFLWVLQAVLMYVQPIQNEKNQLHIANSKVMLNSKQVSKWHHIESFILLNRVIFEDDFFWTTRYASLGLYAHSGGCCRWDLLLGLFCNKKETS